MEEANDDEKCKKQNKTLTDSIFNRDVHVSYFKTCLETLPEPYTSAETNACSLLYFSVVGLDILGELESLNRDKIIKYVYSLQLTNGNVSNINSDSCRGCGFLGSHYLAHQRSPSDQESMAAVLGDETFCREIQMHTSTKQTDNSSRFLSGHIAMCYTSLVLLVTLGDNMKRVDKYGIITLLRSLQEPSGSFKATPSGSESDMRFVYCACAISSILNDWSGVNKDSVVRYVCSCITYEGGIGLTPGAEAQGGATYCAVASLVHIKRLDALSNIQLSRLKYWCLQRQNYGYQGRTNKDPDSCYSFWIGATLAMLNQFETTDVLSTKSFLLNDCQFEPYGGFCKLPETYPDLLHTFYSIAWLSMVGELSMNKINPELGFCDNRVNLH